MHKYLSIAYPTVYLFQTGSKVRVKSGDFLLIKIECTKFPPANHYDFVPNSHSKIIVSLKLIFKYLISIK